PPPSRAPSIAPPSPPIWLRVPPLLLLLLSCLSSSPRPRDDGVDDDDGDDVAVVPELDLDLFTLVALALLPTTTAGRVEPLAPSPAVTDGVAGTVEARLSMLSSQGVVRGGRSSRCCD
ncbi:unnamed protein product, partial [Ectocarpus sp. 8 AP-2014]